MMDPIEVVILTLDTPLAKVTRRLQKGAASNQTSPTGQYLIPNIGSVVGVMFPALLTLVQFDTVTPFSIVVAGLGTVQFVIGNVVKPALMGRTLNLSPLAIILSLTFWGTLWGFVGMSLCVPITVIVATVCSALRWIAVDCGITVERRSAPRPPVRNQSGAIQYAVSQQVIAQVH